MPATRSAKAERSRPSVMKFTTVQKPYKLSTDPKQRGP